MTTPTSSSAPSLDPTRTASIIPFPGRHAAPVLAPEERLARALDSLNAALTTQRSAIAAWREVIEELKTTTAGLDESLQRYRANLRTLGTSVSALKAKASSLEAWADSHTTAD